MGSAFRLPVVTRLALLDAARAAQVKGIRVLAAIPRDGTPLSDTDLRQPSAVLLGGEGQGLPVPLQRIADGQLSVPMKPPVESLNVAVAAALIAYEASRQRAGARS
jgi:TrmH family RNA methyltransferase